MTDPDYHAEPWERVASELQADYYVYRVRQDWSRSPKTGKAHPFYVFEAPDWVNVVALTPEGQVVFVKQYRHGTGQVTLEIPGGVVDPEDASPAFSARRELFEETGYEAERIVYLGSVAPNPALQTNQCHTYLALGARLTGVQQPDSTEEIEVLLIEPGDVAKLIMAGQITHALVVAGFYLFDQYRRTSPEVQKVLARTP